MPTDLDFSVPATMQGLTAALQTIEHSGAGWNLGADRVSRLLIIVEELFSNTIKYGYGGECEQPIRLRLEAEPVLTLTFEDEAPPFDPTAPRPDAGATAPGDEPQVGGAGIDMVLGLSAVVVYRARPGGNCLVVTLDR